MIKDKMFLTTFPQAGFYIQIGHGHTNSDNYAYISLISPHTLSKARVGNDFLIVQKFFQ